MWRRRPLQHLKKLFLCQTTPDPTTQIFLLRQTTLIFLFSQTTLIFLFSQTTSFSSTSWNCYSPTNRFLSSVRKQRRWWSYCPWEVSSIVSTSTLRSESSFCFGTTIEIDTTRNFVTTIHDSFVWICRIMIKIWRIPNHFHLRCFILSKPIIQSVVSYLQGLKRTERWKSGMISLQKMRRIGSAHIYNLSIFERVDVVALQGSYGNI